MSGYGMESGWEDEVDIVGILSGEGVFCSILERETWSGEDGVDGVLWDDVDSFKA